MCIRDSFRLVTEGKYKFASDQQDKARRQIVIGIDEDLNYTAISNAIEARFVDKKKRPHGKYRFLWEVYILSRVIERLAEEFESNSEIETLQEDLGLILGIQNKKFRLSDLWSSYKITTGLKMEQSGAMSPTLSVEPVKDAWTSQREVTDHQIAQIRDRVRKAIRVQRVVFYVLVDKIDDFVVDLEYEEQKKSVQALMECTQSLRYPELKLKIFLRNDLFKRLDFEKGGYDKIAHQVVGLEWSADDIYGFVARRLLYNYKKLQIKTPRWGVSLQMLDVDPSIGEQAKELFSKRPESFAAVVKFLGKALVLLPKIKWHLFRKPSHSERKTNSLDAGFSSVVNFIFPNKIYHLNQNCKREETTFKTFLTEHFNLGGTCANPRLVLLFLQYTIDEAVAYYDRNPDPACKSLQPNDLGEYELILREHILRGYRKLQTTARDTVIHLNIEWRPPISRLFSGMRSPRDCTGLTVAKLRELTAWKEDDDQLRRFIAFFSHVGLLMPDNETAHFEDRRFSLPLVMRQCAV